MILNKILPALASLSRSRRAFALPALMAVSALLWSACSGSDGASGQALNCDPLAEFDRYRYQIRLYVELAERTSGEPTVDDPYPPEPFRMDQVLEGAIDEGKLEVVTRYPGIDTPAVWIKAIDGHIWNYVNDTWLLSQSADPDVPTPAPVYYSPENVCNGLLDMDLDSLTPTPESINGVDTLRYDLDDVGSTLAGHLWGPESDMGRLITRYDGKRWVTEDRRFPLRMEISGSGNYSNGRLLQNIVALEIADINSKDIRVDPPEEYETGESG